MRPRPASTGTPSGKSPSIAALCISLAAGPASLLGGACVDSLSMDISSGASLPVVIAEGTVPAATIRLRVHVVRAAAVTTGTAGKGDQAASASAAALALNASENAELAAALAETLAERLSCAATGGSAAQQLVFGHVQGGVVASSQAALQPGAVRALTLDFTVPVLSQISSGAGPGSDSGPLPLQPVLVSCALRVPQLFFTTAGESSRASAISALQASGMCPISSSDVQLMNNSLAFVWSARWALPQAWQSAQVAVEATQGASSGAAGALRWPCATASGAAASSSAADLRCEAGDGWLSDAKARAQLHQPYVPATLRGRSILLAQFAAATAAAGTSDGGSTVAPAVYVRAELGRRIGSTVAEVAVNVPWAANHDTAALLMPHLDLLCSSNTTADTSARARRMAPLRRRWPSCASLTLLLSASPLSPAQSHAEDSAHAVCRAASAGVAAFRGGTAMSSLAAVSDAIALLPPGTVSARSAVVACPPLCNQLQLAPAQGATPIDDASDRRMLADSIGGSSSDSRLATAALFAAAALGGIRGSSGDRLNFTLEDAVTWSGSVDLVAQAFTVAAGFAVTRPCASGSTVASNSALCANLSGYGSSSVSEACPYGEREDCVPCPAVVSAGVLCARRRLAALACAVQSSVD